MFRIHKASKAKKNIYWCKSWYLYNTRNLKVQKRDDAKNGGRDKGAF
jgi:hypothetical protein